MSVVGLLVSVVVLWPFHHRKPPPDVPAIVVEPHNDPNSANYFPDFLCDKYPDVWIFYPPPELSDGTAGISPDSCYEAYENWKKQGMAFSYGRT